MNPVNIIRKSPIRSEINYELKKEIDFSEAYELCLEDFGKKPTINVLRRYLLDNNLKVNEKSFFEYCDKQNKQQPPPKMAKTNKFKLLAAIILLIGTSVFLFGNTNNFYADKTFINDLKKEYSKVKVPKNFISCRSLKKLSDKAEYYDKRDVFLWQKAKLTYNYIGIHKILVISNLLDNTRVQDGERVFCIREKPLKQREVEEILRNDDWRTK